MRQPSRRAVLASAIGIALGGCVTGGSDDEAGSTDGTPDSGASSEETPSATPTAGASSEETPSTTPTAGASSEETPSTTPTAGAGDGNAEPTPTQTPEGTATVHEEYETTGVTVRTVAGTELGSVTAAIADTRDLRYLGLSDTADLPPDRGMLFVFDAAAARTFVMREMDFGIDIVYADPEGVITGIHHAPAPGPDEDGSQQRYPGQGQYVLEVTRHWTTDRGVGEGDVLEFEL